MTDVVEEGTATKLSGLSYTAAGKTGSAEYTDSTSDSHAWFTGFAPAEDPQIAVTVIIEGIGSGGDYAVPIAKRVFDAYFRHGGVGRRRRTGRRPGRYCSDRPAHLLRRPYENVQAGSIRPIAKRLEWPDAVTVLPKAEQ